MNKMAQTFISDIEWLACAVIKCRATGSGGNSSESESGGLIFRIGTIHPHGLNERFSFIFLGFSS